MRERRLYHRSDALEHRFVFRIVLGVAHVEFCDLVGVGSDAPPEHQVPPVQERRKGCRIALDGFEAVIVQSQIANDFRTEEAVDVGCRRDFEARKDFLGYACAADDVTPLENQDLPLRARVIARGDQAVVPADVDDRIVFNACDPKASASS